MDKITSRHYDYTDAVWTPRMVAAYFQLSVWTVYRWHHIGTLHGFKRGKTLRFHRAAVLALEDKRVAAALAQ